MRLARLALLILLAALILPATVSTEPNARDTRLLAQPATNGTHVAFVYADDLWVAKLDGTDVRRLTTDDGVERNPAFSPDGKLIAFSAQYEGNADVYVVPAEGGVPRRLTWHPGPDFVQGFTVDGKQVLFTSGRAAFTGAYQHLFTVPVEGGVEVPLPIPNAFQATYSPDGRRIAYNPLPPAYDQWKQYRGGRVSRLWLYNSADHGIEKVPQPADRANDVDPMWIGGAVYFRSDRDGEFNVYAYDTASKQVRRITRHEDFPVLKASAGGGKIVYEQAGWLHLLDPANRIGEAPGHSRARGPARDPRPVREGPRVHPQRRHLAVRSPGRLRVPRRNRHRAGREGRRAQHHKQRGRARAIAAVVAGRLPHRLLLGRLGRVRTARRLARRQGRREEVQAEWRRLLR